MNEVQRAKLCLHSRITSGVVISIQSQYERTSTREAFRFHWLYATMIEHMTLGSYAPNDCYPELGYADCLMEVLLAQSAPNPCLEDGNVIHMMHGPFGLSYKTRPSDPSPPLAMIKEVLSQSTIPYKAPVPSRSSTLMTMNRMLDVY